MQRVAYEYLRRFEGHISVNWRSVSIDPPISVKWRNVLIHLPTHTAESSSRSESSGTVKMPISMHYDNHEEEQTRDNYENPRSTRMVITPRTISRPLRDQSAFTARQVQQRLYTTCDTYMSTMTIASRRSPCDELTLSLSSFNMSWMTCLSAHVSGSLDVVRDRCLVDTLGRIRGGVE